MATTTKSKPKKKRKANTTASKSPGIAGLARQVLAEVRKQEAANGKLKKTRRSRRNPPDDVGAPPKKIRELLGEFLGHGIENVEFAEAPAWCPNDAVLGGQCVALEYFAYKPHLDPDGPKIYRHEFEPGACQVVFTADRVIILLGSYTVGPDGIEG